ncbi:hypothetical protein [Sulfurovum sp.]|uniref:hypothetical protein n=1 Tax=Sulfurovum sp. TaxID=1969726 RepID=UPI0035643C6B
MTITLEELKNSIQSNIQRLINVELKQFLNELKNLEQLIIIADESKINMFQKMKNHNQALLSQYKNEELQSQIDQYKNKIKDIQSELISLKQLRKELLIKRSIYMNRLKTALEQNKKPSKDLKKILCSSNQNYTHWIVGLCYFLLRSNGENHKEIKQRMNLLLEEISHHQDIKQTDANINQMSTIIIFNILGVETHDRIKSQNNTFKDSVHPHEF